MKKRINIFRYALLGIVVLTGSACTKEYTCACQDNDGFVSAKNQHQRNKEAAAAYCDEQDDHQAVHHYDPSIPIDTTYMYSMDCWLLE